jgi:hypothetical protein
MSASTFPALPLARPSGRVSDDMNWTIYNAAPRHIPALRLKIKNTRLADLFPCFPLRLYPLRTAYLPKHTLNGLKVKANSDLLIQAFAPELVGGEPLAVWSFTAGEVEQLAFANVNSGVVVIEVQNDSPAPLRQVLTPYWLDWRGWSGYALQLAYSSHLTDNTTLHHLGYELTQRGDDPPSGLYLARAHILRVTNGVKGAAEACLNEIHLHFDRANRPSQGALEAFVLLAQLLVSNHETTEALAAYSLALWLNSNHYQALAGVLPLLTDQDMMFETLARLGALPVPPANLAQLTATCAEKARMDKRTFEKRLRETPTPQNPREWGQRLAWVASEMPGKWLHKLGLA